MSIWLAPQPMHHVLSEASSAPALLFVDLIPRSAVLMRTWSPHFRASTLGRLADGTLDKKRDADLTAELARQRDRMQRTVTRLSLELKDVRKSNREALLSRGSEASQLIQEKASPRSIAGEGKFHKNPICIECFDRTQVCDQAMASSDPACLVNADVPSARECGAEFAAQRDAKAVESNARAHGDGRRAE